MSRQYIWFMDAVEAANEAFEEMGHDYRSDVRIAVIGAIHKRAKKAGVKLDIPDDN